MTRNRPALATLLAALALAAPLAAQDLATSPCPAGFEIAGIPSPDRAAQDACTQAYDVFQFMGPQLAISLAGGNAVLGQGGTLGGLGHISIGARVNAIRGLLPDVPSFTQSVNGAVRRELPTVEQWIGLPTVDAAVGIYAGVPTVVGNVAGLDLLLNASYLPSLDEEQLTLTPESSLRFGYGVRLGVVDEGPLLPGVAVTYLKRDLPPTDIEGRTGGNTFHVTDVRLETTAWRVVARKRFLMLHVAGGVGHDRYTQSADISATVGGPFPGTVAVPGTTQSLSRTNYFLDAGLSFPGIHLTGELGQVSGGAVDTYNSFAGGAADRTLRYLSLGVRVGW